MPCCLWCHTSNTNAMLQFILIPKSTFCCYIIFYIVFVTPVFLICSLVAHSHTLNPLFAIFCVCMCVLLMHFYDTTVSLMAFITFSLSLAAATTSKFIKWYATTHQFIFYFIRNKQWIFRSLLFPSRLFFSLFLHPHSTHFFVCARAFIIVTE